ncbi:GTPase Era [Candidatus Bipolaricaulota bacterium]|nr:GTPase Era [Candidatus Bipolaricaulota bacterium]
MGSFKSGLVGVLGQTNVGKSTFLNAVIGEELLITSPKPQTTRNRIRCIHTIDEAQIVFVDTPGLHRRRDRLSQQILREAFRSLRGLDLLLYMVEPWGRVSDYDRDLFPKLAERDCPIFLLVNKIDLARKNALAETLLAYETAMEFAELIPFSAYKRQNLEEVLRMVITYLPEGAPIFPADVKLDHSEGFLISEIIREGIFRRTFQEVPYASAVRVRSIDERADGLLEIGAEIIVDSESHKGIIIGRKGSMIKQIGTKARIRIESILGARVFLELTVKVRKGWIKDDQEIEQLTGIGSDR